METIDTDSTDDTLLTPEQAGVMIGVAASTLSRWRREYRQTGQMQGPPWLSLGHRTVRYKASAVQSWLRGLHSESK